MSSKPRFVGEKVELGELCKPKQWKSLKQSDMTEAGYPVYGANGIIGHYSEFNHLHETVLVGCRGTCGEVNICKPESYVTSNAMCLDELSNRLDMGYLACFLKAYDFKKVIGGTSQPQITKAGISSIEVPVYTLDEQATIRLHLESVLNAIELCRRGIEELDSLVKSRFVEMFLSSSWPIATIGECSTDIHYGTSEKASTEGDYVYLRMNNMSDDGSLDLSDTKRITLEGKVLSNCLVRKGDLLFNRTNSREKVGKTCVFCFDEPMVIAGYIIRVRLDDRVDSTYLATYMNLSSTKALLRGMAKGAVHQANINAKQLASIEFPLADIEAQKEFVSFVWQVDKSRFS